MQTIFTNDATTPRIFGRPICWRLEIIFGASGMVARMFYAGAAVKESGCYNVRSLESFRLENYPSKNLKIFYVI